VALSLASAERSAGDIVPGFSSAGADLKVGATLLARADLKVGATLLVICLLSPFGVYAEEPIEHPLIQPKDIKPATCLTCHPEKKEGRFVHTAVGMGCENCHHIISEKNKTTITLFATGGDLCAQCHEAKKDPVLHGPYKNGQCLICHDPHSSQFKAQTRSAGNSLCLECHAPKRVTADAISLFSLQKISKADFEAIPKIELDPTLGFGHPCATHPVAEVADPLHGGERMSCLSCHAPHASTLPNLLVLAKGGGDVCDACHRAISKQKEAKLKSQPQQQPQGTPNLPAQFRLDLEQ
jgi:predicted CXXCH cytochrome family protein